MSSWTSPAGYSGESTVAATTYADTKSGSSVSGTFDLYGYQIAADPTRTLVSVTVPSTSNVVIMALGFGSNQQVTVPGTYTYTPDAGTIEPVGTDTLNVSFTPSNTAAYTSATGSTTLVVNKATPVITWPTPAPVTVGTKLSGTQLDATAATPQGAALAGTFVYNPAAGTTMSPAGTYTLNTTFTPTDTIDYTTATASVQLIVGTSGASSLSGAPLYADCCFFAQPNPYTITVGGVSNLTPTGTVQVISNGNVIGSGTLSTTTAPNAAATVLISDLSFYPGSNTVTLKYLGDSNYSPNSMTTTLTLRNPAITVNSAAVGTNGTPTTIHYQFAQAGSININYAPAGVASEFSDAGSGTCQSGVSEAAGFDCTLVVNFKPTQPGTRKGAVQIDFVPATGSQNEPTLYLFLSGVSTSAQIALSTATQTMLNSSLNQPQNAVFNPTDPVSATLYVANSMAAQLDTLSSSGGSLAQWNASNTKQLAYPADLTFDAFDNLVVPDASTALIYSYSPTTLTATTLSTGTVELGEPTQARFDLAGYLYISDGGNTPQIVSVPGESSDSSYLPTTLNLGSQTVSFPQALAVDNSGSNLYIGDGNTNQVLKVALNGNGGATSASQFNISPCDATVASCAFNSPAGFAFDPNGDMYVTDSGARVLKVPSTHVSSGTPTTTMPFTGLVNPTGIALDGAGNIYVTDVSGFIAKLAVNSGAIKFPSVGSSVTTTVTNTGNLNLSISAITLGNGSNSSFTESDTCTGSSIAPGGTCTITVKYATATKGFDTLTITSNAFSPTGVSIALSY
jgi:sugar lactone lactonase YvrE